MLTKQLSPYHLDLVGWHHPSSSSSSSSLFYPHEMENMEMQDGNTLLVLPDYLLEEASRQQYEQQQKQKLLQQQRHHQEQKRRREQFEAAVAIAIAEEEEKRKRKEQAEYLIQEQQRKRKELVAAYHARQEFLQRRRYQKYIQEVESARRQMYQEKLESVRRQELMAQQRIMANRIKVQQQQQQQMQEEKRKKELQAKAIQFVNDWNRQQELQKAMEQRKVHDNLPFYGAYSIPESESASKLDIDPNQDVLNLLLHSLQQQTNDDSMRKPKKKHVSSVNSTSQQPLSPFMVPFITHSRSKKEPMVHTTRPTSHTTKEPIQKQDTNIADEVMEKKVLETPVVTFHNCFNLNNQPLTTINETSTDNINKKSKTSSSSSFQSSQNNVALKKSKRKMKSSVLIGDVEDASDDEYEEDSIWNSRRPSEGQWMEPVLWVK